MDQDVQIRQLVTSMRLLLLKTTDLVHMQTSGYNCDGESLNIEGCTSAIACNYNEAATIDDGSCDYLEGTDIPTGADVVWLVGLTLSGTPFESLAGGCEVGGGVNPDVSINGVIVGDGATPLSMAGITDPTGLLGDLAALASTVQFSICGTGMTVAALGNNIPMVGNGTFWISPIAVSAQMRLPERDSTYGLHL